MIQPRRFVHRVSKDGHSPTPSGFSAGLATRRSLGRDGSRVEVIMRKDGFGEEHDTT